jgi:hypothetical protein
MWTFGKIAVANQRRPECLLARIKKAFHGHVDYGVTPAMEAGVTARVWSIQDLVALAEVKESSLQ